MTDAPEGPDPTTGPSPEPWSAPEIVTFKSVEELCIRFPELGLELERRGLIRDRKLEWIRFI